MALISRSSFDKKFTAFAHSLCTAAEKLLRAATLDECAEMHLTYYYEDGMEMDMDERPAKAQTIGFHAGMFSPYLNIEQAFPLQWTIREQKDHKGKIYINWDEGDMATIASEFTAFFSSMFCCQWQKIDEVFALYDRSRS